MNRWKFLNWLTGGDELSETHRIFNIACLIAALFTFLSGVECVIASLSPILVAANFFYTLVLLLAFYFSRFKQHFHFWRNVGIVSLIFIYLPTLWFFNGGSKSGIPYFIPLFMSFLTILTIDRKSSRSKMIHNASIVLVLFLVASALILIEFDHPEWVYQYTDQTVQKIDILIGLAFSIVGNFMIIAAFLRLYYRQLGKVEEMAVRDSMTNLYNHIYMVNCLTEEIDRISRHPAPLSIVILDIDHFKKINDTHGHITGDTVLKDISKTLAVNCRDIDKIGRYGGDEFLIVLPNTSLDEASFVYNRLLEKVRALRFNTHSTVTFSAGIAQFENGDTASRLIERADQNLYQAKNSGRNRLVS